MTNYSALFDELDKIAQVQRKELNKQKFKRHLLAMGAVLAGGTIGHYGGSAARRALLQNKGRIAEFASKHPNVMKHAPSAIKALGVGAGMLAALRTKKHLQYAEKGK